MPAQAQRMHAAMHTVAAHVRRGAMRSPSACRRSVPTAPHCSEHDAMCAWACLVSEARQRAFGVARILYLIRERAVMRSVCACQRVRMHPVSQRQRSGCRLHLCGSAWERGSCRS